MQLSLQKEKLADVVVFRCEGRIVAGEEIRALQMQVEPMSRQCGKVVLQLANVSFIDSAGVGALARLLGLLRSHGCELSLCQLSPFVERVLQITNLIGVLPCYGSEQEAISGSHAAAQSSPSNVAAGKARIVCADTSRELLEYLSALLKRRGYDVLTARHFSDALTLALVTSPQILFAARRFRGMNPPSRTFAAPHRMSNSFCFRPIFPPRMGARPGRI